MEALRRTPADESTGLTFLSGAAFMTGLQDEVNAGTRPVFTMGMGPTRVKSRVPRRDSSYRTMARRLTGTASATEHAKDTGFTPPGVRGLEWLHLNGHGQVGAAAENPLNLVGGSHGANSQMMEADKALSGNKNVSMDNRSRVFAGTRVAMDIDQGFYHRDLPGERIHLQTIQGMRLI